MKPRRTYTMSNFITDNFEQWNTACVKCGKCGYKWVAVYPDSVSISDLQCKKCGQQGLTESEEEE